MDFWFLVLGRMTALTLALLPLVWVGNTIVKFISDVRAWRCLRTENEGLKERVAELKVALVLAEQRHPYRGTNQGSDEGDRETHLGVRCR